MQNLSLSDLSFANRDCLMIHLVNHVLSPDESHAWFILWGEDDRRLAPDQSGLDQCFRLREVLKHHTPVHVDTSSVDHDQLGKRYEKTIAETVRKSVRLGWAFSTSRMQIGLSSSGVFYVSSQNRCSVNSIVTGFIPGFGTADGSRESRLAESDVHTRARANSRMRRQRNGDGQSEHKNIQQRMSERRARNWTLHERQYYLVFRPVIQFLRGFQNWKVELRPSLEDLKTVLPPMSELTLQDWIALRTKERGPYEL